MNSILLSPTKYLMFINLVTLSSKIIKGAFGHIRGNLGELPNQIREKVARYMISLLLEKYE